MKSIVCHLRFGAAGFRKRERESIGNIKKKRVFIEVCFIFPLQLPQKQVLTNGSPSASSENIATQILCVQMKNQLPKAVSPVLIERKC